MKVLILSYYFPPLGLGGTQRMAKFAKYLPQSGWEPTVVTVKDILYMAKDHSLLSDLEHVRIVRTGSFDPQRILFLLKGNKSTKSVTNGTNAGPSGLMQLINQKVMPFFCIPDTKLLWNPLAFATVSKLLKNEHYDAIISTGPPFSTHLLAYKISRKFGLKWIADFRDDWAGGHVVHEPTCFQRWMNRYYQTHVVQNANAIISVSKGIEKEFRAIKTSASFHVITNGFDPQDFGGPVKTPGYFTLVYSGVISKFSGPIALFKALAIIKKENPVEYKRLKVKFIGKDVLQVLQEYRKQYDVKECVEIAGFMPHDQALRQVMNADALLLIATGTPQDTFIPGKTFEYFAAQKPVLCMSNVADTTNLLQQYAPALVMPPDDEKQIARALLSMMQNEYQFKKEDTDFISQFNRKQQTQKLAEILNSL